jgi:hypothetical protein
VNLKKAARKYLRAMFADHGRVHRRLLRPVDTCMTLAWRYAKRCRTRAAVAVRMTRTWPNEKMGAIARIAANWWPALTIQYRYQQKSGGEVDPFAAGLASFTCFAQSLARRCSTTRGLDRG